MKIDLLQGQIYQQVGYEFNLNSPKQLGDALFGKMGIPAGKKTKSGYSTSAEVLEGLKFAYPVVADILEYRTLGKAEIHLLRRAFKGGRGGRPYPLQL